MVGAVLRRERHRNVIIGGDVPLRGTHGVPAQLRFGMAHSYRNCYAIAGSSGRISLHRAFTTPPPTSR